MKNTMEQGAWFQELQASANAMVSDARLHLIPKLVVDYTRPFKEAAIAGGPQTTSYYLNHGYEHHLSENMVIEETIVLLKGGRDYEEVVKWGLLNGLKKTTPHAIFAIGEKIPDLINKIGIVKYGNTMMLEVLETTGFFNDNILHNIFIQEICYWNTDRFARQTNQDNVGKEHIWLAFRKKF